MGLLRRSATPLEERLGYRFRRPELLELALTHRSFANEQGVTHHYERVEFLGDAVLGLVAAEWLYERHPDLPEGALSKRKSHLVSKTVLAPWADRLRLGEELRLGIGEERSGGRAKPTLLADSLEALFGAVYLDGGLERARAVIRPMLEEAHGAGEASPTSVLASGDPKTRLQEIAQAHGWSLPGYRLVGTAGPDHDKVFTVECALAGAALAAEGTGPSKKVAEQRAAAALLALLLAAGTEPDKSATIPPP
ncbi:MAG TPA: ribonuclease III [Thermoanaerobaculia bacterium]|nr:ribonuclease III [Thermoanaerobaculia bacterium]